MATFYVENFGCRATQADGASIERQFEQHGLNRAETPATAEVVVLNTCTVTAAADHDARAAIRRIRRQNPNARIVVTGCYAQRAPEEIAALPGVSQVIGNSHKHRLAEISIQHSALATQPGPQTSDLRLQPNQRPRTFVPLSDLTPEARSLTPEAESLNQIFRPAATGDPRPVSLMPDVRSLKPDARSLTPEAESLNQIFRPAATGDPRPVSLTPDVWVSDIFAHTELLAAPVFDAANERTRPILKIQDGCNNRCSFCVIPYVRGQSRSLPLERILQEVRTLVAAGYQEVVISGINLGRWGRDLTREAQPEAGDQRPATSQRNRKFEEMIRLILQNTDVSKLRISSVEPMDWSDDLIALVATSPRIAKHAHIPMQSGSDSVLRRMHRKYRPQHYVGRVNRIRAAMPDAAIGADVMVGFPGETDAEFEETLSMVEALPFTYLHVFTYSPRPGTPAASMSGQVHERIARERNRMLRDLASQKKLRFMQSFVGKSIQAITLSAGDDHYTEALTDNFLKLRLHGRHQPNQWLNPLVTDVVDGALIAHLP